MNNPTDFDRRKQLMSQAYNSLLGSAGLPDPFKVPTNDLEGAMSQIHLLEEAGKWLTGDLVATAKLEHGPMKAYRMAAKAMGKSVRLAFELAKVSEAFPPDTRISGVPWTVYRACANTSNPQYWLDQAASRGLTPAAIRRAIGRPQAKDSNARMSS